MRAPIYTTGEVTLLSAVIGDMNGDGSVDVADAGILFGNWGGAGEGDLNIDGIVDAADAGLLFEKWTGDTAVVPEPSTITLLLGSAMAIVGMRRRHN